MTGKREVVEVESKTTAENITVYVTYSKREVYDVSTWTKKGRIVEHVDRTAHFVECATFTNETAAANHIAAAIKEMRS